VAWNTGTTSCPYSTSLLQRRQLDALGPICDELLGGPPRRRDALPKVDEFLIRNVDAQGADCEVADCELSPN
jgi:hypothetical protein